MNLFRNRITFFLSIAIAIGAEAFGADLPTPDDALKQLSAVLNKQETFYNLRENRIDSLKSIVSTTTGIERANLYGFIADEYTHYQIDSALVYLDKASTICRKANDYDGVTKYTLNKAALWSKIGAGAEAVDLFDSINPDSLSLDLRQLYYLRGNQMYLFLAGSHPIRKISNTYLARGKDLTRKLVSLLDKTSPDYDYHLAELCFMDGDNVRFVALCKRILSRSDFKQHIFAKTASMLGDYYEYTDRSNDLSLYYKTLASISDIMTATREEMALQHVGTELFKQGEVGMSYKFLMCSIENAAEAGSRVQLSSSAQSLPMIASTFRKHDRGKLSTLTWLVAALTLALIIIIAIIFFLRRKMRTEANMKCLLQEANAQKETFINQFLTLCSIYMEKLEEFNRIASRKIKAGQVEDLYNMIKSGKMLDEQNTLFCNVFDCAFTRIYPSFVEGVNNLLQPDKQIKLSDKEALNTELRILAFMRLGLDDSMQIARFLQLSLNTIYTYRNKLKNKAINRNTFEKDVMKIERIE